MILRTGTTEQWGGPAQSLAAAWRRGELVALAGPGEKQRLAAALGADPDALARRLGVGAGVVVGSGGSSGERRWCVQPLAHLEASADACGAWLEAQAIDPGACLHLNPLPWHHVSGLLPLVRCRRWGAELRALSPALLRRPERLAAAVPLPADRPVLLSLVPTQLARLLACPQGRAWLEGCRVIWVGGAPLPVDLAAAARRGGLPLAPCYGASETAAMVTALEPQRFLAGEDGCGRPLADVRLRLGAAQALEVATARLSPGWLERGRLRPLRLRPDGWWRSGDAAELAADGALRLCGRLDGAIHSGGETVFPESLETRLQAEAGRRALPLAAVLFLPVEDPEWGQRLVALVRPAPAAGEAPGGEQLLGALQDLVACWPPAERPRRWLLCEQLAPSPTGKWERWRWRGWLERVPSR